MYGSVSFEDLVNTSYTRSDSLLTRFVVLAPVVVGSFSCYYCCLFACLCGVFSSLF